MYNYTLLSDSRGEARLTRSEQELKRLTVVLVVGVRNTTLKDKPHGMMLPPDVVTSEPDFLMQFSRR
jgi:hypothetical protein